MAAAEAAVAIMALAADDGKVEQAELLRALVRAHDVLEVGGDGAPYVLLLFHAVGNAGLPNQHKLMTPRRLETLVEKCAELAQITR